MATRTDGPRIGHQDGPSAERTRLLSDLFHTLSQPLASLHCWLELAARYKSPPSAIRRELAQALECVQQITWPIAAIRELMGPATVQDVETIRLREQIGCLVEELMPVAQSCGVSLRFRSTAVGTVNFPKGRIHELLFRLLESSVACAHPGDSLEVSLKNENDRVLLGVATCRRDVAVRKSPNRNCWIDKRNELSYRTAVCSVRAFVEIGGGQVVTKHASPQRVSIVIPRAKIT
jgi:signal transduction histidine kinase